ncbi:hypothetical protein SEA_WHEELBITE_55 [Arthrobacter phage Wheelbite]|uniref:Uncharacterized protein n=1 Tax=Arthrobacter phage Wheelbite TaxID=2015873 RepID=A0A222ZHF1_9CAUD|nr:hypothetical protein KMD23_gp55 [Arthrobacter phage Wheelbite]ASR84146.1 hypothetical protein SEA_WHEELBITE_55 [Arthrobacter phage Wheelbite]
MNKYEAALEPLAQELRHAVSMLQSAEATLDQAKARRRKCRKEVRQLEAALKLLRQGGARLVEASPGEAGERREQPAKLVILDETLPAIPATPPPTNGRVIRTGSAPVNTQQRSPGVVAGVRAIPADPVKLGDVPVELPKPPSLRWWRDGETVRVAQLNSVHYGQLAIVEERRTDGIYELTVPNSAGGRLSIHGGYLRSVMTPGAVGERFTPGERVRFAGTERRGEYGRITGESGKYAVKVRPELGDRDPVVTAPTLDLLHDRPMHNKLWNEGERVLINCPGDSGHNRWAKVVEQEGCLVTVEREDTGGQGQYVNYLLLGKDPA